MSLGDLDGAIARGRIEAEASGREAYPVLAFITPTPLDVYAEVMSAIGEGLGVLGWSAHFREITGLGVVWIERDPAVPWSQRYPDDPDHHDV